MRRLPQHDYQVGGTLVELVDSAWEIKCAKCDAMAVAVPNEEGLFAAVALDRVRIPVKLSAREVKFLRKTMKLSAKSLAGVLDVTPETVSRWESGKLVIGPQSERMLRMGTLIALRDKAPAMAMEISEPKLWEMKITPLRNDLDNQKRRFETVRLKEGSSRTKADEWDEKRAA